MEPVNAAAPQAPPNTRMSRWLGTAGLDNPSLGLADVLWFFGAISAVAAAISIVDHTPRSRSDLWLFLVSLGFLAGFALCGWLLHTRARRLPAGIVAGMAVAMIPAAGYGLMRLVHVYPRESSFSPFDSFNGGIFGTAVATGVAALVAYALTRVAVNLALAVAACLLSAQLLVSVWHVGTDGRATTAVITGCALVVLGLMFDAAQKSGEAFWLYAGGLAAVTVGIAVPLPSSDSEVWIAMLLVGTALLLGFWVWPRRTWVVFGTINLLAAFAVSQNSADTRVVGAIVIASFVVATGLIVDVNGRLRLAFWLYLGGFGALLEGLVYHAVRAPESHPWIPLLAVGALLLVGWVAVGRKTWVVFGVLFVGAANASTQLPTGGIHPLRALAVAAVVVLIGILADLRRQRVTGFWLQLWGLIGIAEALAYLAVRSAHPETRGWVPMLVVGAVLLLGSPLAQRRLWVVFGALGVAGAFGHYLVTEPDWFRYALLAIGVAAFAAGLAADRTRARGSAT